MYVNWHQSNQVLKFNMSSLLAAHAPAGDADVDADSD